MSTSNTPPDDGGNSPLNPAPEASSDTDSQVSPSATDSPYSKDYDENPVDDEALLQAAESVPIKDYSDYEIEIETKTEFADALFSSDEDLDSALDKSEEAKQAQANNPEPAAKPDEATEQAADSVQGQTSTKRYDFSPFLERVSSESLPSHGINRSPAATDLPPPETLASDQPLIEEVQPEAVEETALEEPQSEPKTFAEKLKFKARLQFSKSKAHLEEYIGRSLPERELPLEFAFPVQKSKKDFDQIPSNYSIKKLFEDKGKSLLSVFKQADLDLGIINKCQMMASSRHSLLDAYSEPLIRKTLEVIHSFERKPNLCGDTKRLALATHCESAFKHLVNGYKQIYAHYYESSNVVYGPQRNAANAVLSRLLEILLLEAQICFALHTQVPSGTIKTMNKLFTVARLYEPQLLTAPLVSLIDEGTTSIKAIYFHFQALLALDGCNVSSLLYRVLHPYLLDKLSLMSLREADTPADTDQQRWTLSHEHSSAPRLIALNREGGDAFPPTVIDVTRFLAAIKSDYADLIQHRQDPTWKPANQWLAGIKRHYAVALMASLNQQVQQHEQSKPSPTFSIYQPVRIRSYSGLGAIIGHLHFSYEKATRKPERPGESVTGLPENPKLDKLQWRRAQLENDTDYLQISEEKALAQLDIGQPVLLIEIEGEPGDGEGAKDRQQPDQLPESICLGLIGHAHRLGQKLNLSVCRLGGEITHATLNIPGSEGKMVLLAHTPDGLLLMTDYMTALPASCPITLPDGSQRDITIGDPIWLTPKCQVLQIH